LTDEDVSEVMERIESTLSKTEGCEVR